MFRTRLLLWCSLIGLVACQQPDTWTVPVTTGISWELASYRATKIGGVAYQLAFNSFEASFAPQADKRAWEHRLKECFERYVEND